MKALALLLLLAAAPAALATEIGYYQWLSPLPEEGDLLTAAREAAAEAGGDAFRFYLGARFDYLHPYMDDARDVGTPAEMLEVPRYRAALDDARFSTIVLTAYSAIDYGAGLDDINLLRPFGEREREAVNQQMGALVRSLYERYGDQPRTIILANHEADEKLMEAANYTQSMELGVDNLIEWINVRQAAVERVRGEFPDARLRLLHAFEISVVNLKIGKVDGRYTKTNLPVAGVTALDDVLPHIRCDLVSYSAYEATNSPYETLDADRPPAETGDRLLRDLRLVAERSRTSISGYGRRTLGANHVMIGELGFARETFEPLPTGGVLPRLQSAIKVAERWGAPWVILWQVFDAPRWGDRAWGFGAVDAQGGRPSLIPAADGCASVAQCVESWAN